MTRDGSAVTTSGLVLTILPPISENNKNTTLIKLGYSFVLATIWSQIFSGIVLNVGIQLNEKQLSLSGISNSLTESSKFHKMRTFPRQSKPCMLCSVNIFLNRRISISGLVIQMSKSFTSCCFQLDIFLRKRIDVAINIPLLLSLPHSITGHHCCQSSLHVASGVDGTAASI